MHGPDCPQYLKFNALDCNIMPPRVPTGIDIFCGMGGLSLGMQRSGVKVLAGVDMAPDCVNVFRRNFPNSEGLVGDVNDTGFRKLLVNKYGRKVDIVCGGVPCQPFSKRNIYQEKGSSLPFTFIELAVRLKPKWIVMEEVPNIRTLETPGGGTYLNAVIELLSQKGYVAKWRILDASEHGVPQRRKRLFIVATNYVPYPRDFFPLPRTSEMIPASSVLSPPYPTVTPLGQQRVNDVISGKAKYNMGYRLMDTSRPSPTVTTMFHNPSSWYVVKKGGGKYGRLTPRNALAIQGFPPNWKTDGRVGVDRVLIGNSVPPELARRIFECITMPGKSIEK